MAGFVAAEEVEPLNFDFKPYGTDDENVGVIPEPSSDQIQQFRTTVSELIQQELPDIDDEASIAVLRRALIAAIGKDQTELQQKMLQALADVCSNRPSFDLLHHLPWRHQQAFTGWISGIFLLPNASTLATKA